MINRAATTAMSAQLERVNMPRAALNGGSPFGPIKTFGGADVPPRRLSSYEIALEEQVRALQRQLQAAQNRIEELETQHTPIGRMLGGRPTYTAAEAAKAAGVSVSTVSRYCTSGHWQAKQQANGHWLIYSDQPLGKKQRPRREKAS